MLFPTLVPSSLPVVVAQPDERHGNRTASVLEWHDRHRTSYNIWSKRRRLNAKGYVVWRGFQLVSVRFLEKMTSFRQSENIFVI